ncbi:hypothetical protein OPQ81_009208 [Rhizoctonia solani]|nr:hypothetical protein OPQ81_009208 [Rhizoctonia solani]
MRKKTSGDQLTLATTPTWLRRFWIRGLKVMKGYPNASPPQPLIRPRAHRQDFRSIHSRLVQVLEHLCDGGIPDGTYPTLDGFIAYGLFRSNSDIYVHYYTMHLIWRWRMHIKDPEMRAYHSHDTYLTALMVAKRMVSPEDYASELWDKVGQSIYSLEILGDNEQRLCKMVDWEVEMNILQAHSVTRHFKATIPGPSPLDCFWTRLSGTSFLSLALYLSGVFSSDSVSLATLNSLALAGSRYLNNSKFRARLKVDNMVIIQAVVKSPEKMDIEKKKGRWSTVSDSISYENLILCRNRL